MIKLTQFFSNEEATTAVEYALLLAFIGALMLASIVTAGGVSGTVFGSNATAIDGALK